MHLNVTIRSVMIDLSNFGGAAIQLLKSARAAVFWSEVKVKCWVTYAVAASESSFLAASI